MTQAHHATSVCRITHLLGAMALAMALTSCGDSDDPMATYTAQTLTWQACDAAVIDGMAPVLGMFGTQTDQFGQRLRCATMRAPIDYAQPTRGELQVALMRVAVADSSQRQGAILFNPGGPGGDGQVMAPVVAGLWGGADAATTAGAMYRQLARSYDMVGFSPRGTGSSTLLTCTSTESMKYTANETADRSSANIEAMLFNARLIAQACTKNPLAPHINTDATARDMDLMRHLLGEAKLNYYGISYGTWLGTWYATLFPERVGRMLLTGVVDQQQNLVESFLNQPMGFQRALQQMIVPYAARHADILSTDGSAANLGAIFGTLDVNVQVGVSALVTDSLGNARNAARTVLALVAGKKVNELLQASDVAALISTGQTITAANLVLQRINDSTPLAASPVVNGTTYDLNQTAKELAKQIADSYFNQINRVTGPVKLSGSEAVAYAITSNDYPMSLGVDGWIQTTNFNASKYPLAGGMFTAWPSLYWGAPSVSRPSLERATQAGDIVMLQTALDAQTPIEGTEKAFTALPNASLVLINGDYTHGPFVPYGQACVDEPIARYFLNGTKPPRRTECTGNPLLWDQLQPGTP